MRLHVHTKILASFACNCLDFYCSQFDVALLTLSIQGMFYKKSVKDNIDCFMLEIRSYSLYCTVFKNEKLQLILYCV